MCTNSSSLLVRQYIPRLRTDARTRYGDGQIDAIGEKERTRSSAAFQFTAVSIVDGQASQHHCCVLDTFEFHDY